MSERDFEAQLERLYRDVPALPDEREFLRKLEAHIESEARRRRGVLIGCGSIGACVSFAALSRFDVLPWLRIVVVNLFQMFERLLSSMGIVHFAALGVGLLVVFALREIERNVGEASD